MATDCGTCHPPADGTRDREIVDRFADFLRAAGRPLTRAELDAGITADGRPVRLRTPAERYHLRFLVWRCGPDALDLAEAWG